MTLSFYPSNIFIIDSNLDLYSMANSHVILRAKHQEIINGIRFIWNACDYREIRDDIDGSPILSGYEDIPLNIRFEKEIYCAPNFGDKPPFVFDEDETYFIVTEIFTDSEGNETKSDVKYQYRFINDLGRRLYDLRRSIEKLHDEAWAKIVQSSEDANSLRYKAILKYVTEAEKIATDPNKTSDVYYRKYFLLAEPKISEEEITPKIQLSKKKK